MTTYPTRQPATPRRALFWRRVSAAPGAPRALPSEPAAITPLPLLDALMLLAKARGIAADRAALAAALPIQQDIPLPAA